MSSNDRNAGASIGQDKNSDQIQILNNLVQSLLALAGPSAPSILPHGLYTSEQIERNLSVSPNTLAAWREHNGLFSMKPGTSKFLYYGEDVINFCRQFASGKVVIPRTAKAKAALRKAKKS